MNAGRPMRRYQTLPWLLTAVLASASVGSAWGQARFTYSPDGSEVTDGLTGLVWRRCSEGQSYSGDTCVGSAAVFTHEGALVQAKAQTGWRLPNVKELGSIVDTGRVNPSIDPVAFPATPINVFWSSSPWVGGSGNAWLVNFIYGSVYFDVRNGGGHVRLVR